MLSPDCYKSDYNTLKSVLTIILVKLLKNIPKHYAFTIKFGTI